MYGNSLAYSSYVVEPAYSDNYREEEVDNLANGMGQMNFRKQHNGGNKQYHGRGKYNKRRGRGRGRRRNNNYHQQQYQQQQFYPQQQMYMYHPQRGMNMGYGMDPGMGDGYIEGHGMYQHQYGRDQHGNFIARMQDGVDLTQAVNCVADIRGRVYGLARTQTGCRQLQKLLDKEPVAWKVIYAEVEPNFSNLVVDPFGHHLCLRLLDFISEVSMRENLLQKLKEDLVGVSMSVHGTRVIQKLLEMMQTATELRLVQDSMSLYVITLAKDVYGMHVILRCLHRIPPPGDNPDVPSNQFIFDEITKNIVSVATHKHGCCVVQWCIDYATPNQRRKLVEVIVQNSLELSQDAFGNYVVQQIMDPTHPGVLQKLVQHLKGSITKLAVQKFSSIVIEKCLEYTESEQQMQIINELVNPQKLPRLLQDPYANYVIQKALSVTRQENFQKVVSLIRPHLASLSNTPFGKRIKTQMIRRFPILSMGPKQPPLSFDQEESKI